MSCSETSKVRARIWPYIKKIQNAGGIGIDIGCGFDRVSPEADGVDAVHPISYNGPFWTGDISKLGNIGDGAYDYVFSSHAIEYFQDTETTLREWIRVLKDNGTFFLYAPFRNFYPNIGQPGSNPDHKHDFAPSDLIAILKKILPELWIVTQEVRGRKRQSEFDEYSLLIIFRKHPPEYPRFLIKTNHNIGDSLTAVQVAKDLKHEWLGKCEVHVSQNTIGLLNKCPWIDYINTNYEDPKFIDNAYDGVISMVLNEHQYGNYYRRSVHFRYFPSQIAHENGYLREDFTTYTTGVDSIPVEYFGWDIKQPAYRSTLKYVVMSPDVFIVRAYPKLRWNELIKSIISTGKNVVLVGQNQDVKYYDSGEVIDLRGKTPTINDLVPVIQGAEYVVCPDTGIAHVAATLGKPHVVIGGPADLDLTFYNSTVKVKSKNKFYGIQNFVPATGKYNEGEQPFIFSNDNPPNTMCPSMLAISCQDVIDAIRENLDKELKYKKIESPTLSACITERNESKVIERCMESVIGLADEIVIHDTGSTDNTVEVVKAWVEKHPTIKVKIVETGSEYRDAEGNFHFGNGKTRGFQEATSDFVMWLDASDWVIEGIALRQIFEESTCENKKVFFECITSNSGSQYRRERIVPREGAKIIYPVHEVIQIHPGLTKIATNVIIKRKHEAGHDWKKGVERNLKILEGEWKKATDWQTNGYNKFEASRICFYLANTYRESSKYNEAIQLYQRRSSEFYDHFPEEVYKSYEYIAECTLQQAKINESGKTFDDVVKAASCCIYYWNHRREGYYYQGDAHMLAGQYKEAIDIFEHCLSLPRPRDAILWLNENIYSDNIVKANIDFCKNKLPKS